MGTGLTLPEEHSSALVQQLEALARRIRLHVVRMVYGAGSGHLGGALSSVDILTALYFHHLRIDAHRPHWEERDRFVLSKGNGCAALYATLAEAGFFSTNLLAGLRQRGTILPGHPDMRKTPGIDMSTGSLGTGISVAVGMALGGKHLRAPFRVYAVLGDGECQEGEVWEAAMAAAHYGLDNLTAIVDHNRLQIDGFVAEVMSLSPLSEKWQAFRWHVREVDGHDVRQILDALDEATTLRERPCAIVAHTVKGKGVSFMENVAAYHGKVPDRQGFEQAIRELQG